MAPNYDAAAGKKIMDFNELCALHKERVSSNALTSSPTDYTLSRLFFKNHISSLIVFDRSLKVFSFSCLFFCFYFKHYNFNKKFFC